MMTERIDSQTKKILEACPDLENTPELSINDLAELRLAVCSLSAKWFNLGICFGIPTSKLEELRTKHRDPDRCLTSVLAEWITNCNPKHAPPTRKKLVIAVATRVGADNPALARRIAMQQYSGRESTQNRINVDDRQISGAETMDVLQALMTVATKWVSVGILLGIPYDRLQILDAEEDLEKKVSKLVEAWLDRRLGSEPPSWKTLVEAIASKAGGDHQTLAKKLASDHPVVENNEEINDIQAPVVPPERPSVSVDVFKKEDIAFLMRELRDVAPKWQILCPQLGIPMSELNIIAAKPLLLSGAPLSHFQSALDYWIGQSNPTLSTLCEALRSPVVGESSLAQQFEERFLKLRGLYGAPSRDQ